MTKHRDSPHLMIQTAWTWVLIIKFFCYYCDRHQEKLKDVLRKIDGVLTVTISAAEEKVTVTGNVASADVLLKKLVQCDFVREVKISKDGCRDVNENAALAQSKTQDNKSNTRTQQREQRSTRHRDNGEPKMYEMETLSLATNHFDLYNKVGEGGFGPVYKGITHDGKRIAVKKLCLTGSQGSGEFLNEVKLLAKVRHPNLVKLLGFCEKGLERLIVYEFLPNESLDKFLFNADKCKELDWQKRYDIMRGTASGLHHLHQDCKPRIVHRDIKPSNILLDHKFNPKIADFGISKLFPDDVSYLNTRPAGSFGYMAPECMLGELSSRADVYSFGVVLLELTTGRKITDGLRRVWRKYEEGNIKQIIDPAIIEACDVRKACRCIHVGLLCTQLDRSLRPSMSEVNLMLSTNSKKLAEPKKPPWASSVTKTRSRSSHAPAVTPYFASPFPSDSPLVPPARSLSRRKVNPLNGDMRQR